MLIMTVISGVKGAADNRMFNLVFTVPVSWTTLQVKRLSPSSPMTKPFYKLGHLISRAN